MKKALALAMALLLLLASLSACGGNGSSEPEEVKPKPTEPVSPEPEEVRLPDVSGGTQYTFTACFYDFPETWNPHAEATEASLRIRELISSPLVSLQPADTETGGYVWVYEMAESIEDVTGEYRNDLKRFCCNIGANRPEDISSGYVFRISLRPGVTWETGEAITAEDYVLSMKLLLDPARSNPAAGSFCMSEAAPAGAEAFASPPMEWDHISAADLGYASNQEAILSGEELEVDMWGFWGLDDAVSRSGESCPRWVSVTDVTEYQSRLMAASEPISAAKIWELYSDTMEVGEPGSVYCAVRRPAAAEAPSFEETVGCYALDDSTFIYVTAAPISMDKLFESFGTSWLVYRPYYERMEEDGYATTLKNTVSFGPYKLSSCVQGDRMTLTRNPHWYGWSVNDDGTALAYTGHLVDGEHVQVYKTTRVMFYHMSYDEAKQAYYSGELTEWEPSEEDALRLVSSDRLFITPGADTLRLVFNSNETALHRLDGTRGNRNSIVLSNYNFRRALSLSLDRVAICSAIGGSPSLGLIGGSSSLDAFGGKYSEYRSTHEAMQAICELYGVEYGGGTTFESIEEAYASIDGYDPELAHELLSAAADELISEGKYKAGDRVRIRVACSSELLSESDQKLVDLIRGFLSAAARGTPFGEIELEAVGKVVNIGDAVISGRYAIGFDVDGGSLHNVWGALLHDCDSGNGRIPTSACWDPNVEPLTLIVHGREVTKTWLDWSRSLIGSGEFAAEDDSTKLGLLAELEREFLRFCYCVPLLTGNSGVMLSEKAQYLTPDLSPLYFRGGFRFLAYNYTDEDWASGGR